MHNGIAAKLVERCFINLNVIIKRVWRFWKIHVRRRIRRRNQWFVIWI